MKVIIRNNKEGIDDNFSKIYDNVEVINTFRCNNNTYIKLDTNIGRENVTLATFNINDYQFTIIENKI